jgi:type IV pilus assembly protein PilO
MELTLTKLPWYAQVGAFVALAGVGVGVFVYYYEIPARADMASRETQLTALRGDINKGLNTAKKLPEFQAQVGDLEGRLANLKQILPEEKDAADLLNRMQTVAAQSNMTIKGFKPNPTVTKQLHAEWPITLELEGSYHNLALFFDRVGKFTRIVNISGLDVKGKDNQPRGSNVTISATCVATTFVLLDKPQAAKPGGRGAAPPAPPAKGA